MLNRQPQTLNQALLAAIARYADRPCFWAKQGGQFQTTSYRDFGIRAFRLANFLRRQGVLPGERVAIIANNSVEWMMTHVACLLVGGIVVPLRIFLPPKILCSRLKDSGACLAVVQGKPQVEMIAAAEEALPELKTVVMLEDQPAKLQLDLKLLAPVLHQPLTPDEQAFIQAQAEAVEAETVAAIYYIDGEMAKAGGAIFTHAQRLAAVQLMADWFPLTEDDLAFTTPLPLSYPPNLNASLHYFLAGVANALTENTQTSFEDLQQISPTVTLTNPYAFEYIYQKVITELNRLPEPNPEIFQWALAIGREYRYAGSTAPAELYEEYVRADLTFFNQIRGMIGGRLRRFYSVGAPLPPEGAEFAEIVGLMPLDIYSLTEAGGFPAATRPGATRSGSCGQVALGFQIKIASDQEVLVKGPTITRQYWRRASEDEPALDPDGWLHTGDLGYLDEDGYLYLTGRKYVSIALSSGRKIIPAAIENALMASPFISQAAVFGEGRLYVSALIVPDREAIAAQVQRHAGEFSEPALFGLDPSFLLQAQVALVINDVVLAVNSQLDSWEQIEQYTLLERPFIGTKGELTDSNKINRDVIAEQYSAQIEAMYPQGIQRVKKAITQLQLAPERLRELLEKENILDAWLADAGIEFLFQLARQKQIDAISMVHLCDAAATIAQLKHERHALSTAFIVGDLARIGHVLPESEIQLRDHVHIRRARQLVVTLAPIVDGLLLGYVVDKYGYLRDIRKLDISPVESGDFLLGPQFRHHALISEQCEAVVFFVPKGGRQVRVFANGQLIGRYANGNWLAESLPRIDEILTDLVAQQKYDPDLLRRLLSCAFQMSEENLGAIFIVGEADFILKQSDPPEITPFATVISDDLAHLSDQELINFARQDGATVIDREGRFRSCMVLLRPKAETLADIGPGRGARHSSAAKISAEAQCLAITVSQDGPITLYDRGRRILSL
jgi:long-chain acyl-CoA synthetase